MEILIEEFRERIPVHAVVATKIDAASIEQKKIRREIKKWCRDQP